MPTLGPCCGATLSIRGGDEGKPTTNQPTAKQPTTQGHGRVEGDDGADAKGMAKPEHGADRLISEYSWKRGGLVQLGPSARQPRTAPVSLGQPESKQTAANKTQHTHYVTILAQSISAQSIPPSARPARPSWLFRRRAHWRRPPSAGGQRLGGGRIKRGRRGAAFVRDSSRMSTWAASSTLPTWIGRNGER